MSVSDMLGLSHQYDPGLVRSYLVHHFSSRGIGGKIYSSPNVGERHPPGSGGPVSLLNRAEQTFFSWLWQRSPPLGGPKCEICDQESKRPAPICNPGKKCLLRASALVH